MGWQNPQIPWKELERRLSGRPATDPHGDAPISRKRRLAAQEVAWPEGPVVPYAELHAHSDFSFLDGASAPAKLVEEAIRRGLHGLAITDHDGFYGAPALAEAARKLTPRRPDGDPSGREEPPPGEPVQTGAGEEDSLRRLRTVYGAELSLGLTKPQNGVADPEGSHLLVLARGVEGYRQLSATITEAQLRGDEKGRPSYDLDELADLARAGHWQLLTGCRKGHVRQALADGPRQAAEALREMADRFGRDNVVVELTDRGHPTDSRDNDVLAAIAADLGLSTVATNNVHYATPDRHRVADALAAVRARRTLADIAGWLPAAPAAYLRSGEEMLHLFRRFPGAVERSVRIADECAFDLQKARPHLPKRGIPEGHTAASWLRHLTEEGFKERYEAAYDSKFVEEARERVEHELEVITEKDFPGYFVIVHDIVQFARSREILCQGRGSAAASAVCYALGITAIDPVFYKLPFERFISKHREEEPDIDVDFDSDRREEVIQWVFQRYGRRNAAQVANVVGYRPKMAVRDAAKALGHSPGQQDAWSKHLGYGKVEAPEDVGIPDAVIALAKEIHGTPRHLGIHSGGMVLTEEPLGEVVPIERARMDDRTVLQWDKDAAEFMGLVKFDLLGLGMLSALDHMMRLTGTHLNEPWTLATIPKEEPAVYDMLCRADSIGVFQVESRAQIGTLPRLQPRCFYDLAIEIALIRPGPIQGGAVHPYVRRATGKDPVEYAHPALEPVLERTLGVPLFQEQLMEMGKVLGDFSADEADLLRRAMGSKRGEERIESLKKRLYTGMAKRGLKDEKADAIYTQILSFANFGFAESHALSFAKLVYASSWFKLHYPAAFLVGLLRAQPMGFYSAQSLTQDAKRHGVDVRRPDLLLSSATADLEPTAEGASRRILTAERARVGASCTPEERESAHLDRQNGASRRDLSAAGGRVGASCPPEEAESAYLDVDPGKTRRLEPRNRARRADSALETGQDAPTRREGCLVDGSAEPTQWVPGTPDPTPAHRRDRGFAVRLGLDSVRGIGTDVAERIVTARNERPFEDALDLSRRAGLERAQLEALATAGVLDCFTTSRRQALWASGWTESEEQLEGLRFTGDAPDLGEMSPVESMLADLWATGVTPGGHPFAHLRPGLIAAGLPTIGDLPEITHGTRITVAGMVTHRQRPGTAGGVTFINLEDETGMLNVVCSAGLWARHRKIAVATSVMLIRGILERNDGVTNLVADRLAPLAELNPEAAEALSARHRSRDFH